MTAARVEMRLLNLWRRHGLAVWIAAGTVARTPGEAALDQIIQEIGLGYRFEIQPRQNVRIDVAWGDSVCQFYFEISEAF